MGTNYYIIKDVCPHCGRGGDRLHIGKSSYGWHFSLHVIPEEGLTSLVDWKKYFMDHPKDQIRDEYGQNITAEEMMKIITERSWTGKGEFRTFYWYQQNHAEPGLNGLVRHMVDNWHCIGHGEGTWDYIIGEFC